MQTGALCRFLKISLPGTPMFEGGLQPAYSTPPVLHGSLRWFHDCV